VNFDDPKLWLQVILALWNIALTVAIWLRKPGEEAKTALNSVTTKIAKVDSDVRVMQETLKHMPTREEVSQLSRDMATVKADNHAQTEMLRGMNTQLMRMDDYLRKHH
jgi:hypothetical protein